MQTEAVFPDPTHDVGAMSAVESAREEAVGQLVTFVRAGRPPLRVRASPGPSIERAIGGERCRIALWRRAKGGVVIELDRPSPAGLEPEVITADSVAEAALALENASFPDNSDVQALTEENSVDAIIMSSLHAVRVRSASRAFRSMISDFLALLGPEAEVVLPGTHREGESH